VHFLTCGCTVNEISDVSLLECVVSFADHIIPVGGVDSCSGESATPRKTHREYGSRRLNVIVAVCQNSLILHPGGKEKPRCKRRKTIFHGGEIRAAAHRHAGPDPPTCCFSETSAPFQLRHSRAGGNPEFHEQLVSRLRGNDENGRSHRIPDVYSGPVEADPTRRRQSRW